jgi:hypothetical protein
VEAAISDPVGGPDLNARDYYLNLQRVIHAKPHVLQSDMRFEEIDTNECYVRGVLKLINDLELHIAEYIITAPTLTRPKYRYHLQTSDGEMVSRWDNAAHHSDVPSFPHHRHDSDGVHPSSPMTIPKVLDNLLQLI